MKSGEVVMEIKALQRHCWSVTSIAEEFDLARGSVYAALRSEGPRQYGPRKRPMALNESQLIHVERRLVVVATIRGTDLHQPNSSSTTGMRAATRRSSANYACSDRRWCASRRSASRPDPGSSGADRLGTHGRVAGGR